MVENRGDACGDEVLHVGRPNLGDVEYFQSLVADMFDRRWFTNNGPYVQELERRIEKYLGVKHCLLVCNATIGLQLACHALELSGEVIVPAFTFIATAHAPAWQGLTPVFADVDPVTHVLDPTSVEAKVTERTSAILGVHLWGNPCDTRALDAIAAKHKLQVFYDAAHAFACRHQGQMTGNFGRCEVFSFHATKFFNTFEGGAITTNDDALMEKLRRMNNFGFAGLDSVVSIGTNGKMSEVSAAMGLANLGSLERFMACNQKNYWLYRELLDEVLGIRVMRYDEHQGTNWQYVVIEVDEVFGVSRDELVSFLGERGIKARRYFYPGCRQMEPYVSSGARHFDRLPVTDRLCQSVLCLPTGTAVRESDVRKICQAIGECR